MDARYVYNVRFRVEPDAPGVAVDPREFETRLYREAAHPGDDGWLFFRNTLWRGELNDETYVRELAEEALGVPVVDVSYRAFELDAEFREQLVEEIVENLELFNAESVEEVLSKYFGSSLEVQ